MRYSADAWNPFDASHDDKKTKKGMRFCSPVHRLVRRSGANVPRFGSPFRLLFCSEVEVYGHSCEFAAHKVLPLTLSCNFAPHNVLSLMMSCTFSLPTCDFAPLTVFMILSLMLSSYFFLTLVTLPLPLSYDFVPHAVLLLFLDTCDCVPHTNKTLNWPSSLTVLMIMQSHCGGDSVAIGTASLFPHLLGSRSPPTPLQRQLGVKYI